MLSALKKMQKCASLCFKLPTADNRNVLLKLYVADGLLSGTLCSEEFEVLT